jgi:hypothetical protein
VISAVDSAADREAALQQSLANNADLAAFVNQLLHIIKPSDADTASASGTIDSTSTSAGTGS